MNALLQWLASPAFTSFGAPTSWAELLGFSAGAWCVWLVARQHILNWPVGIANNLLWILLFAGAGLYADSGLQVVFIVLALWGWWQWLHEGGVRRVRVVSRTTGGEWLGLVAACVAGTAVLTWFLDTQTPSTVPFWDSVTTMLSLLAVYGQAMKRWESWLIWMTADVVYVPLYLHKGLTLTAILYVGFFLLCVKGLLDWRRDMRLRETATAIGTPAAADLAALDPEGYR